jgi:DNA-binding transcriptional LysR family regulator
MELRQLKIFCAIADCGSFTAAAEKICTVQSNVTMRVRELELELSQQLFIRHKNGVVLTPSGEMFLGYARRILHLVDESRNALSDGSTPVGHLRLGSMETTAAFRLPNVLTRYRSLYPQVKLSLLTGTTTELIKAVEAHRLDGAFVGGFHENGVLSQEEVIQEDLVLLSSEEFESLPSLIYAMPQQTVLVFRSGCFYRSTLEHWLYHVRVVPNQVMELGTLDGILSCVAAGMGVTLLPEAVMRQHHLSSRIRCHALPPEVARAKTVFIRRNDVSMTPAVVEFLNVVREEFGAICGGLVQDSEPHAEDVAVDA